jgi:hypothetical protein
MKENLVIKMVLPVKYTPFNNYKGKNIKGVKRENQKAIKMKRNVVLKINNNKIL